MYSIQIIAESLCVCIVSCKKIFTPGFSFSPKASVCICNCIGTEWWIKIQSWPFTCICHLATKYILGIGIVSQCINCMWAQPYSKYCVCGMLLSANLQLPTPGSTCSRNSHCRSEPFGTGLAFKSVTFWDAALGTTWPRYVKQNRSMGEH